MLDRELSERDKQATERVLKARAELIMSRRFYGVLVSNVEPVLSRSFPTMATDGKRHFFNPDFIVEELTQTQLLAVQAHESEHDARHHHSRRGGRDPKKWNEATDYAINVDLVDEGFDLPPWALLDEKYRGMSAEDIYRSRELDEQQDQPQGGQNDDDKPQGEGDDDQPQDGDDKGNGDAGDDEGEGGSSGDGDEGDDEAEGKGNGDDEAEGEQGQGSGDGEADEEGEGSAQQSSGDPGRCGEVLDASDNPSDLADSDQEWERIVRQAASMAKSVGELPGHITREIERANSPTQDWREVLRAWIDQGSRRVETWNHPNRRFSGRGLILPGSQRDGLNKVVFVIDTSGSMDAEALRCVNTEAQAALDDGAIDEVIAVYGDTTVTRVDEYVTGDEIKFDPRGGGGTDLRPLFQYVEEQVSDASLIICFTDMEIGDAGPEPSRPVLFAATGYPDKVRRYLANAPWGAPGIDVGAH